MEDQTCEINERTGIVKTFKESFIIRQNSEFSREQQTIFLSLEDLKKIFAFMEKVNKEVEE